MPIIRRRYKYERREKPKNRLPDSFWSIKRPEVSLKEVLKDGERIEWEEVKGNSKKKIIVHSVNETN